MTRFRSVTLEMTLKPLRDPSDAAMREVCRTLARQWRPLIQDADSLAVLLFAADGSEILEYTGDASAEIEWARYIGFDNPAGPIPGDPGNEALHSRAYLYRDDPPRYTYADLKRLVTVFRDALHAETGLPVRLGAFFDPGPEFAHSPFKYERHPEICMGGSMGQKSMVCCYARLHADERAYAGFPDGIPEGTPFGRFFGRQCERFLSDMGFDYLWLSNGFGFGMETWRATGALFDGKVFHPERAGEVRDTILEFWRLFREECPHVPVETRGTNLSTGMDLASDGVPLKAIYEGGFNLAAPPNSPWAAINGDFGLELAGWMSHIVELPSPDCLFRFYTHDPWWLNSPWLDRYGREPHDIYLPLTVGRVTGDGAVHGPDRLAFLTVEDSFGHMPDQVPEETIPHLKEAWRHRPDRPGPLVWVYPFTEYHDRLFHEPDRIGEVFFGDWFIRNAINNGLPLNTVVSSENALRILRERPAVFEESILLLPLPDAGSALARALCDYVRRGGRALFYGPIAHGDAELLSLLGLAKAEPLSGSLNVNLPDSHDSLSEQPYPSNFPHHANISGGGIAAVLQQPDDAARVYCATLRQAGAERAGAVARSQADWRGGCAGWVRGSNVCEPELRGSLLAALDPMANFPADLLLRYALAAFGLTVAVEKDGPHQANPLVCIARIGNGFRFATYAPNANVRLRLRLPQGAPVMTGGDCLLRNGVAVTPLARCGHSECRIFVEQESGEILCREVHSGAMGVRRRIVVRGLCNAVIRFYPEPDTAEAVRFLVDPKYPYMVGDFLTPRRQSGRWGAHLEAGPVTGTLLISW